MSGTQGSALRALFGLGALFAWDLSEYEPQHIDQAAHRDGDPDQRERKKAGVSVHPPS